MSTKALLIALISLVCFPLHADVIEVYVYNTEFSINMPGEPIVPAVITQGDTIRWVHLQGGHTTTAVASSPEQWDEIIDSANPVFERQFTTVGVFWYYCIPHGTDNGDGTSSGMASTITVLPAGSGACCLPDYTCITTDESDCLSQGGTFSGIGTLCDTTTCQFDVGITALKDNILYESPDGSISNGSGIQLYAGNNNNGIRRSVLAFDLSAIPAHAEVESAQLQLYCNNADGAVFPVTVQKLLKEWGEGASDANGQEGNGDNAAPGDATWLHTYFDTGFWETPGGDFQSVLSATTDVDGAGQDYTWSGTQLNADVASWIAQPDQNNGWILRGDEASANNSKRFSSRQANDQTQWPSLQLQLKIPPTGACCLPDGSCALKTQNQCSLVGGNYFGDGTDCSEVTCAAPLTPYLDPLPLPGVAMPVTGSTGGKAHYRIEMEEHFQTLHTELPPTRVWGYNGSYPGPTIEAWRDSLVTVTWVNNLRTFETDILRDVHALAVDTCLHGPNMTGEVPVTVTHLHGGKVPPGSDGYPEDTFAPGDSSEVYNYPNIQPAGILWYHDHALGITRLNVMMGLAGLYFIRDDQEAALNLPSGEYEVPLVIQDKTLRPDGTMTYPADFQDHFFGDHILVNGKVWPYFNVKQGKYRFRLVNGSNSRVYTLHLSNGAPFVVIGGELGLFDTPVGVDTLTMLPGERYDVIVDFAGLAMGTEIILENSAPAPFPGFPGVGVIPNIMKFVVQAETGYTADIPATLVDVEQLLPADAEQERIFELITIGKQDCDGQVEQVWTINGLLWDDITEKPIYGSTEIWTWHNQSGISHPMHMHLVTFQVLDRQAIDESTGEPVGPLLEPEPWEKGWKDTAHAPPGFRTRVIARFNGFTGLYPYHCHILEHEDHEMMRQFEVTPCNIVSFTEDYRAGSLRYAIECASEGDTILFDASIVGDTIRLEDTLSIPKDLTLYNGFVGEIVISGAGSDHIATIETVATVSIENLTFVAGNGDAGRAFVNGGSLVLDRVDIYDPAAPALMQELVLNRGFLDIREQVRVFSGME